MVTGAAAADAVARAGAMPSLGVGLHLVLVEGRPALPPSDVPMLVDETGALRRDMARLGFATFANPSARRQLYAEIEAQFALFAATGLPLDHVNAHKHFHVHPTITSAILAIGPRYGMKAMRAPVERGRGDALVRLWAMLLQRRLRRAGMLVPDQIVGLAWSGAFDRERMRRALTSLSPGLTEIYTHPAAEDAYPGSAPGYRYRDELAALVDRDLGTLARNGSELGNFTAFMQ